MTPFHAARLATILLALPCVLTCAPPQLGPDGPPNVPLVTQAREIVGFRDRIRGEVVLINFMFTKCNGFCPRTTRNLARVQPLLGDHLGRDVFIYSISLDPTEDTPEVLADFAADLHAAPGWTFLTGKIEDITRLRRSLGLFDLDPAVDADRTQHSGVIVVGDESTGAWKSVPGLADPQRIADSVLRLLRPRASLPPILESRPGG